MRSPVGPILFFTRSREYRFKGSGEGGSYTGAFPGFPSVSADLHQPPLRALSIPGAWVLRSPDLVVVSSFRMHCTFPIWTYRWCIAFNFDPRVLGIQPCHPSGSKPAAHFFRTEVRTRDLQVAMTSRYQLYQYQFFVNNARGECENAIASSVRARVRVRLVPPARPSMFWCV